MCMCQTKLIVRPFKLQNAERRTRILPTLRISSASPSQNFCVYALILDAYARADCRAVCATMCGHGGIENLGVCFSNPINLCLYLRVNIHPKSNPPISLTDKPTYLTMSGLIPCCVSLSRAGPVAVVSLLIEKA
jgi:hypothetical protein